MVEKRTYPRLVLGGLEQTVDGLEEAVGAYSGEDDRLFRGNVTGDSAVPAF